MVAGAVWIVDGASEWRACVPCSRIDVHFGERICGS